MGDAKKRGTFEQRKVESIEREAERQRSLPPPLRRSGYGKAALIAAGVTGIFAGATLQLKDQSNE